MRPPRTQRPRRRAPSLDRHERAVALRHVVAVVEQDLQHLRRRLLPSRGCPPDLPAGACTTRLQPAASASLRSASLRGTPSQVERHRLVRVRPRALALHARVGRRRRHQQERREPRSHSTRATQPLHDALLSNERDRARAIVSPSHQQRRRHRRGRGKRAAHRLAARQREPAARQHRHAAREERRHVRRPARPRCGRAAAPRAPRR